MQQKERGNREKMEKMGAARRRKKRRSGRRGGSEGRKLREEVEDGKTTKIKEKETRGYKEKSRKRRKK